MPKASPPLLIAASGILLLAAAFALPALQAHAPSTIGWLPPCPVHAWTGFYCPGCGSARAVHDLLNFRLIEALDHNALLLAFGCALVSDFAWGLRRTNRQRAERRTNFLPFLTHPRAPLVAAVVLTVWVLARNVPLYPFSLLAP